MSDQNWNSWKVTTLALLLMGATSLVTTLVVGYRSENSSHAGTAYSGSSARKVLATNPVDVSACHAYAEQRLGHGEPFMQGINETRSHDGEYQAAYLACMRRKGY